MKGMFLSGSLECYSSDPTFSFCYNLSSRGLYTEDVKKLRRGIFTCFDSQATLREISSPRTRSVLVQEYGDVLECLARLKQVSGQGSGEPSQGPEPILEISRGRINGALSKWI
ncbi:hypothetical protein NQ315_013280 [Exocentrus adspersus]|uniref:Uncharacterized protein n=1 Tax=Exocentrus adspersus TaxID=1586481 RepID=A0AAV8VK91_9CUCU|nr:hypothetical protein NQ315_013280 [Exocentrus adspersus]